MRKVLLDLGGLSVEGVVERDFVLLLVAAVLAAGGSLRALPQEAADPEPDPPAARVRPPSPAPRLPAQQQQPGSSFALLQGARPQARPRPTQNQRASEAASIGTGRKKKTAATSCCCLPNPCSRLRTRAVSRASALVRSGVASLALQLKGGTETVCPGY